MRDASTIGLDIAKEVFQAHGANELGETVFNRKLRRSELLDFFRKHPKCLVGIEACGTAHFWARSIQEFGHEVRLIHPTFVKPFVKRDKTDAADAEAINEALTRKTMRFVAIKSAEHQAVGLSFRLRTVLVRQRAQLANSLRSQLAEFGVLATGSGFMRVIEATRIALAEEGRIPIEGHFAFTQMIEQLLATNHRIANLDKQILSDARRNATVQRLMTIPGIGPMSAMAIVALAPPPQAFPSARHFSSWLGLTPRNYSSGGQQKLGASTKMGNRQIRTLLVLGALSLLKTITPHEGRLAWASSLKQRRPYRVAAVALASKTARIAWALMVAGGTYEGPQSARSTKPMPV